MEVAIVGAGFTGAVIARELAEAGYKVTVFDERNHVAGNCHTERDAESGVMTHVYGPHIFHTDSEEVWAYVNRFGKFQNYRHQVKTIHAGQVFSMPINLHTINQFFKKSMSPSQASCFIESLAVKNITSIESFEQQALAFMGPELYEAFFKNYTEKQWAVSPKELPASILQRLPMRFSYNDNYFNHPHQGIPIDGYTAIVSSILNHPCIDVHLGVKASRKIKSEFEHVFFSGPLDAWFEYESGSLGYRTLDFTREVHEGDYQGCPVVNYADSDIPYTRISEHKHFAPWEEHDLTLIYKEYSRACGVNDIPYYPIRLVQDKSDLVKYVAKAQLEENVSFVGRLATYRYIDMDKAIAEALDAARAFLSCRSEKRDVPSFFVAPI
jgi:UDP-galactopyranose mutase